jgi:hypothetical protein
MALAIGALGLGAAYADDEYDTGMQRVKTCNLEASARKLTGDARQSFIAECVSGAGPAGSGTSTATAPSDKTLFCNMQASNRHLAGKARAGFVEECLKAQ